MSSPYYDPNPDYGAGDSTPWLIFPGNPDLMIPGPDGPMPFPDISQSTRPIPTGFPELGVPFARLSVLADLCPYGSGPCGCGALPRLCSRPGCPAETFRPACLSCVATDIAAGILDA